MARQSKTFKFKCFGRRAKGAVALDGSVDAVLTVSQNDNPRPLVAKALFSDSFSVSIECPHICGAHLGECNAADFTRNVQCPYSVELPYAFDQTENDE